MGYNLYGGRSDDYILVGVTLDAPNNDNNFPAMKQLLDIGKKRAANPNCTIADSEFNIATAGIVAYLPRYNASLYDGYSFEVLWQKNKDVQHGIASVTKILTAVTGLPHVESLSERVTFVSEDIETGTGNLFSAGDIITVEEILYGLMFWSSNSCAKAFARHIGRKLLNDQSATPADAVAAFVTEMNRVATSIGCINSEFDSPSGLSAGNLSTVSDLLRITIHASSFRELNDVWNKTSHTMKIEGDNPRTETGTFLVTTNSAINAGYTVFGGKPGSMTVDSSTKYNGVAMIAKPKVN